MKRSVLTYVLACILACMMAVTALAGCGSNDDRTVILHKSNAGSNEKVVLSFFGYKADALNLTAIEAAIQGFMEKYGNIDVAYEGIKGTDYWEAFDKRKAANVLDDVFMMHHDHVISLSSEGMLADLSDLEGLDNLSDTTRAQIINEDGSVYFIPTQVSTYNMYVNYDLLEKHGQKVPENWKELQHVCDYFTSQGIVPIIANNRNSIPAIIQGRGLFDLYQKPEREADATLESYNQNPGLLAEELAPGVEMAADMLQRGWFDPAEVFATEQTSDDLELFLKGDRPFMFTGGWAAGRVSAENPSFNFGVYPYPILEDGAVLPIQVDTCISVNANSDHLEEAKQFVEYLIKPNVMWKYCDSQASYSPLKDSRIPTEKSLAPSVEYLTNGRTVNRAEYRLNLPTELAITACANALLNGASASEAQGLLVQELVK